MDSTTIQQNRLYEDLADLIPLICPPEGYAEEVAHWRTVLREKLGEGHHAILELGVGGGHNLSHLVADFTATGIDLSQAMLDQCRRLNPGVELHRGDIRRPPDPRPVPSGGERPAPASHRPGGKAGVGPAVARADGRSAAILLRSTYNVVSPS